MTNLLLKKSCHLDRSVVERSAVFLNGKSMRPDVLGGTGKHQ
jgi:hypothetical protein